MSTTISEAVEHYREHGYAIVRGALSDAELAALQAEASAQIEAGPDREPAADFMSVASPDGEMVYFRTQNVQDKPIVNDSMLLLMGHPIILELTTGVLGPDAIPYANALLFKGGPQSLPDFGPHRDTTDMGPDGYQPGICSVDVYLDDSSEDNGCLRVVPDTHLVHDVRSIVEQKFGADGMIPVPMQGGDVLLHDGMVIHGSLGTPPGAEFRRVVYPTFQSAGEIMRRGLYSGTVPARNWVRQWMKMLAAAVERRGQAPHLQGETQYPYSVPPEWQEEVAAIELTLTPSLAG